MKRKTKFGKITRFALFRTLVRPASLFFSFLLLLLIIPSKMFVLQKDRSFQLNFGPRPRLSPNGSSCGRIVPHGGDCQAIGPRRPPWDCPSQMRAAIPAFLKDFSQRPIKVNMYGLRLEESFALWFMLKSLLPEPTTVIESGVHNGHSTWLIRKTLPNVRIISLDPREDIGKHDGVEYFNGANFSDFNSINWAARGVDIDGTVVFLDDHQDMMRRIFREGYAHGFRRFLLDDNWEYLKGDMYSVKWACERKRKEKWLGKIKDDFAKVEKEFTWEQHMRYGTDLDKKIKYYYEFPPFSPSEFITWSMPEDQGWEDALFNKNDTTRPVPLFSDKSDLLKLNDTVSFDIFEDMRWYFQFLYVELN